MEQTKEQLQKEIMEILYTKSLVKPVWVTCSEVYWNIQNIKVTERSVREALDWLVKNEVVLYQGDKYQINKREFIEMSKRKAMEEKEMSQETSPQPENTGMNDNKTEIRNAGTDTTATMRKNYLFYVIIALIAFLLSGILIGILCFNHYAQKEDITPPIIERQDSLSIQEMKISTMGYIKDEYTINRNLPPFTKKTFTPNKTMQIATINKVINNVRLTLNQKAKDLDRQKQEFQTKVQNNAYLTQERAQQEYNRIAKLEQDLQNLGNKLQAELMSENEKNSLQLRDSINAFLKEYNKTKGYSMIISNTGFDNLLYADSIYNITREIIDGLNARYTPSSVKK